MLLGGADSLYEVGKGIVKRYRMIHAQASVLSDSQSKRPNR